MNSRKAYDAAYDREKLKPVILESMCTGEQWAGFRDLQTGAFSKIIAIRCEKDLDEFLEMYGIGRTEITKEW